MAITLDTNLYSLKNSLNISAVRMVSYTDKTVEEIIEAEAAQGNVKAQQYAEKLFGDEQELIETFKLDDVQNKYNVLASMSEKDLEKLLPELENEDLILGLNFFTQEKLLDLLGDIPIEQLVNVALELFPLKQIMEMMPDKELNKFVLSDDLDKDFLLEYVNKMPPEVIAAMIEAATGLPVMDMDPKKLSQQLNGLDDDAYQEAMIAMNSDAKREMIMKMYQEKPEVMQLFAPENYVNMVATLQKPEMMEGMVAIETEQLIEMVENLPKEYMSIVLTQIDTKDFAEILIKDYQDVLAKIVAA